MCSGSQGSLVYLGALCFVASLGGFLFGFDTAVVSGTLGFVTVRFALDELMLGWVVSSALLGSVCGAAGAGRWSDRYGRRTTLQLSAVLFSLSALGCMLAPSAAMLAWSRWVGGLGIGVAAMLAPLYIAEIAPPKLRGRLVACYQLAITLGILVAYLSNAAIAGDCPAESLCSWHSLAAWRAMFGIGLLPALLFLLLLLAVPESPRWLIKAGRVDTARRVLARFADAAVVERQLAEVQHDLAHEAQSFADLVHGKHRRSFTVALGLAILSQLCGINAVIYYGPSILERAGLKLGNALGGQVLLGFVNMSFTLLAMWKVDTLGRRPLLLAGTAGIFLSLIGIGAAFVTGHGSGWFVVVLIAGFLACFAFSLGPLPWILMAELFPTRIRGRAMSLATLSLFFSTGIVAQTFPWLAAHFGIGMTFWLYAALVAPVFVLWRIMPETRGRSLEELAQGNPA